MIAKCDEAKDEFYTFVEKVYKGLYHMESRVNGIKLPLVVFCRFDIGLIWNANDDILFH